MAADDILTDWQAAIETLFQQVEGWAAQAGWPTSRQAVQRNEAGVGHYATHELNVQVPAGRISLIPVARHAINSDGRVDLYAWPTMHRFLVVRRDDHWELRTEDGIEWPEPWSAATFTKLARRLVAA